MKKGINLFKKREEHSALDDSIKKGNFVGIGAGVILFIAVVVVSLFDIKYNAQLTDLTKQKSSLEKTYLEQKALNARLNYIASKKFQLQTYLKDDANYSVYYKKFSDLLTANSLPLFTALSIDNTKKTSLVFEPRSPEEMQKLFDFLESDTFLNEFDVLTVNTASYDNGDTGGKFLLQFAGTVKDVQSTF